MHGLRHVPGRSSRLPPTSFVPRHLDRLRRVHPTLIRSSAAPLALLALGACGQGARALRPDSPTFASATHSSSCVISEGRNEPFIVDWPADKRSDLEVAVKQKIPVVAYDCDHLRVLPDCELGGGYQFIGVTEKEEVIQLEDSDEVRGNLPFSGAGLVAKAGAELQRGSTIDIAYAIIGKRVSSRPRVARRCLRPRVLRVVQHALALVLLGSRGAGRCREGGRPSAASL